MNKYRKSLKGMTASIYHGQVRSSKIRGHVPPNYTLSEFRVWCFMQPNFNELYINWIESDCKRILKPSADRSENDKPYTFDNLRLVTFSENISANSKIIGSRPMPPEAKAKLSKARKGKVFIKMKYEWSSEYPCCQECGTTDIKHEAKGKCHRCYNRNDARKRIHEAQTKYKKEKGVK